MADAAEEEIPQLVNSGKKPCVVDGETPRHSLAQKPSVTKVLDDDNLLREIIVRVGLPTTLVRVSLVCKRWLAHASDRKFLSRFCKLHPPRLLGYYITQGLDAPCFVPKLPQPPELATVMRRLESYSFGAHKIMQSRNGSVFTKHGEGTKWTHGVHCPLRAEKGMQIIPPLPPAQEHNRKKFSAIVPREEGNSLSYLYVLGESTGEAGKSMVRVHMLQDGVWRMHTSATCLHTLHFGPKALFVDNKIYMPTASGDDIIVLDLVASSFSTIQLPQGVKYLYFQRLLSRADDDSSVYLIHAEDFQLRVWLHKGDNWLLVDTICFDGMLAVGEDSGNVQISQVGDNGQSVYLRMGQCIVYLDIKCRTLFKVYENTVNDRLFGDIHPFMMTWPPTFPALKDDGARKLSDDQ